MKSTKSVRINSTCTVFAGAELRDRLSLGEKREDIMAGLHRAIILRAMSILARSGGIRDEFTFTGGVAKNEAAVKALKDLVRENYGELTLNIDPDSIYTGALGGGDFRAGARSSRKARPIGGARHDGVANQEHDNDDHSIGIDIGSGAVKIACCSWSTATGSEWLVAALRAHPPPRPAWRSREEGFDGVLRRRRASPPTERRLRRDHRRRRERQVRHRPLLLDDHARARRRVPATPRRARSSTSAR